MHGSHSNLLNIGKKKEGKKHTFCISNYNLKEIQNQSQRNAHACVILKLLPEDKYAISIFLNSPLLLKYFLNCIMYFMNKTKVARRNMHDAAYYFHNNLLLHELVFIGYERLKLFTPIS